MWRRMFFTPTARIEWPSWKQELAPGTKKPMDSHFPVSLQTGDTIKQDTANVISVICLHELSISQRFFGFIFTNIRYGDQQQNERIPIKLFLL